MQISLKGRERCDGARQVTVLAGFVVAERIKGEPESLGLLLALPLSLDYDL